MGADIFIVGISWRTAPVAERERLAFRDDEIAGALDDFLGATSAQEGMILSTCNRVEIYGVADGADAALAEARSFLARSRSVSGEDLAKQLYEYAGDDAVKHSFRVASALDSMVLGESQILGQLKDAYGTALSAQATGPVLGRCMERAFEVAKRVRTDTAISRGAANVSSVAVELARRVFGELEGKLVLLVGAGKMSALAARHLVSAGASAINVTNRSPERAQNLAKEVEGLARPWEELPGLIAASDVVITSTGSREPILTRKVMKQALKKRRYRPQVIVDIAVPRDVEASVATLDGAYLFDIDDLERVVAENLRERKKEAEAAEEIVGEAVDAFSSWLHQLKVVPTIRSLRDRFTEVANREAEKTIRTLDRDHTPEERAKAIRRLSQLIVNKLLHTPTTALKGGSSDEVEQFVEVTNRLFDLSSAEKEEASDSSEAGESGDDIDEIKRGSA